MKLILTEEQVNKVILEYHDRNKPYVRKEVFKDCAKAPGWVKSHLKGLPRFYIRDEQGNPHTDSKGEKIIYTTIPEIIYDYIKGNF